MKRHKNLENERRNLTKQTKTKTIKPTCWQAKQYEVNHYAFNRVRRLMSETPLRGIFLNSQKNPHLAGVVPINDNQIVIHNEKVRKVSLKDVLV